MIKIIWHTFLILGIAFGVAVLLSHAVSAGWLPGITPRFIFGEGSRLEPAFEGRSSFRESNASRPTFPLRPEPGDRDFDPRTAREERSVAQGLAELGRNLGLIALMIVVVSLINFLIRLTQRAVAQRS